VSLVLNGKAGWISSLKKDLRGNFDSLALIEKLEYKCETIVRHYDPADKHMELTIMFITYSNLKPTRQWKHIRGDLNLW